MNFILLKSIRLFTLVEHAYLFERLIKLLPYKSTKFSSKFELARGKK